MLENILLWTDSYNPTHHQMRLYKKHDIAYMYNRKAPIRIFGLAGLIHRLMTTKITKEMVEETDNVCKSNKIDFPRDMFMDIVNNHDGDIPLKFQMLPEFILLPRGTPFLKIENTEDGFAELVTYWEGYLTHCFYTSGCFTRALEMKWITPNIHNFGWRGSPGLFPALDSALAMSLVFGGTDTLLVNSLFNEDLKFLQPYKDIFNILEKPNSIPAASHKVIQSFPTEEEAYEYLIDHYSKETIAFPIDTYDPIRFIDKYIYQVIEDADFMKTNVCFRIDSGELLMQVERILDVIISYETKCLVEKKSYPMRHKIIIGDSMTFEQIVGLESMINFYLKEKYGKSYRSTDYVHYGWGANFYNDVTRDKYGIVTKLGQSDYRPVIKTTKGKESLAGDLYVKIYENKFYVSEYVDMSSYVDYKDAVSVSIFRHEVLNNNPEPILIIDNELKRNINKLISNINTNDYNNSAAVRNQQFTINII